MNNRRSTADVIEAWTPFRTSYVASSEPMHVVCQTVGKEVEATVVARHTNCPTITSNPPEIIAGSVMVNFGE